MTEAFSTRELEWFNLETRMRDLLHEQLSSIGLKTTKDRESHTQLKIQTITLEKRIEELEKAVLGTNSPESAYFQMNSKIAEIEGCRKQDLVKFDQEIASSREKLRFFNSQLSGSQETMKHLEDMSEKTNLDMQQLKLLTEDNKGLIVGEISALTENFRDLNKTYLEVAKKADERSYNALQATSVQAIDQKKLEQVIEATKIEFLSINNMIRNIQSSKLDFKDFDEEKKQNHDNFKKLESQISDLKLELEKRDIFIEKYLPISVAAYVSDVLHGIMDPATRRKLAEFETFKLKELHNDALDCKIPKTIDIAVTEILENLKHVEQRKIETLAEKKTKKNFDKSASMKSGFSEISNHSQKSSHGNSANIPLGTIEEYSPYNRERFHDDMQDNLEKFLEEQLAIIDYKLKQNMDDKYSQIKNSLKSSTDECMLFIQQVLGDLEALDDRTKRDKLEIIMVNSELKRETDDFKKDFQMHRNSLASLVQMVVCLVENAQIEQALAAQDEEDRHNLVQNLDKELSNELALSKPKVTPEPHTALPSASFQFQKKCLGCGGATSILTGIRTTMAYKSTPLYYRSKKFNRLELIELKGKMLKNCWDSVSENLP